MAHLKHTVGKSQADATDVLFLPSPTLSLPVRFLKETNRIERNLARSIFGEKNKQKLTAPLMFFDDV